MTASAYLHDIDPWSDSDPELQPVSTATLEILQDHAIFHMRAFLHVHDILDKEITNRKLESRFRISDASTGAIRVREILFNINDFEPLNVFLGAHDNSSDGDSGPLDSEHRDAIAKMGHAWVSVKREAARKSRSDGPRPVSVKPAIPGEAAAQIDIGGADGGSISFQDVVALEDEMDGYDEQEVRELPSGHFV